MSLNYSHDHLGSVWYHSEPSKGLISQTSNWSGAIFGRFLQQTGSRSQDEEKECISLKDYFYPIVLDVLYIVYVSKAIGCHLTNYNSFIMSIS